MPRLRNDRWTTPATSASQPARMRGSASRTVTSTPRSPIMEANSQPMAPPPITAAEPGSASTDSSSSEVITTVPSTSKPSMVRGSDPVARITDPASRVAVSPALAPSLLPSPPVTVTVRPGPSDPVPEYTVTLRRPSSPDRPPASRSMICCLRAMVAVQFREGGPAVSTPNSPARATVLKTEAVSSSSLAGMQPTCRQVPPTRSFSTRPTSSPAAAP